MEHFQNADEVFHAEPMTRWHKAAYTAWLIAGGMAVGAVFGVLIWLVG